MASQMQREKPRTVTRPWDRAAATPVDPADAVETTASGGTIAHGHQGLYQLAMQRAAAAAGD